MMRRSRMHWAAACGAITAALMLTCGGSSSGSIPSAKKTPASTVDMTSETVPQTSAGAQLTWFLDSVLGSHLSQEQIDTHFDASFRDKMNAAKLSEAEFSAALAELPAPGSLVEVLSSEPTSLVVLAEFGAARFKVTLSVDVSGLIDQLQLAPSETSWSQIDKSLAALAPDVSFLAARVANGSCRSIHQLASSTPRPLGSEFKLFVLGALANEIAAGRIGWKQQLTVESRLRSAGNVAGKGSLQFSPGGTKVSVQETATKMISISDNTAADMLINLVGQPALESQVRQWSNDPQLNSPFLTTRQLFLLHYVDYPRLANAYLAQAPSEREAFLKSSVDPLPLSDIQSASAPRDIDRIEWFASPEDICRAFVGLQQLSHEPTLSPIASIFSVNNGNLGLHPSQWPTVWFKGGSEPGVLTLGYLATDSKGKTFVVSAMLSNPTTALAPSTSFAVLAAVVSAFDLVN
jgi:beta-lactamase class A